MKETRADRILDAMMPYIMLGLLGFLAAIIVAAASSVFVNNPERAWIKDCAKYRPLVECQADARALKDLEK